MLECGGLTVAYTVSWPVQLVSTRVQCTCDGSGDSWDGFGTARVAEPC